MKYNIFLLLALVLPISLVSQSTLIENITIVDVENGKTIPNQHILIQGETISKISSKKINTNENTNRINGKDNYIMPGMIDTHIHFFQTGSIYTRPDALDLTHINSYGKEIEFAKDIVTDSFKRYLRLGITSVMDLGGPFYNFKIRDSIAKNNISPNVYLTGPLFSPYQPKAFASLNDIPIEKINSIEEATTLFNKMLPYKPDFIKVWYIVQKDSPAEKNYELVKHIGNLAHQNNLKLAVHATQLQTAKFAIKAGADILVHSVQNEQVDKEFIDLLKKNDVSYIPTLIVGENYGKSFLATPDNHKQDLYFGNPKVYQTLTDFKKYNDQEVPETIKSFRQNRESYFKRVDKIDSIMLHNLKTLVEANINIATGTDAGNIGTVHASSYIQEIEAMKKSGISNIEILKASTINAAKAFGLASKLGSITQGKIADLVILDKNPLDNLQHLNSIQEVIKSGKSLDIQNLIQENPEQIVQRQVNAYNAKNIEAFMETYADNIKIYNFPNELKIEGKEKMRPTYERMFNQDIDLYCEIKNRIVLGNKVIDREYVKFGDKYSSVIAIYEVTEGKISMVTFLR